VAWPLRLYQNVSCQLHKIQEFFVRGHVHWKSTSVSQEYTASIFIACNLLHAAFLHEDRGNIFPRNTTWLARNCRASYPICLHNHQRQNLKPYSYNSVLWANHFTMNTRNLETGEDFLDLTCHLEATWNIYMLSEVSDRGTASHKHIV
jgi:hypothetical protein